MEQQKPKDTMIVFKSTKKVVSKKGADGLQLSMAPEQVELLLTSLTELKDSERGVKLSVYVTKKTTEDGREFESGIAFVNAIQEFGSFKKAPMGTGKFKPKAQVVSPEVEAKIKKINNEL